MNNQIDPILRGYATSLMESTRKQLENYAHPLIVHQTNIINAEVLEEELGIDIMEARHVIGVLMRELLKEFEENEEWVNGFIELEESEDLE
ncbi:MAG: hypothetical protein LPK00_13175 [Bacillaceae bacterium]|nr:hypothetical protein [Bacillaceae bacterium]